MVKTLLFTGILAVCGSCNNSEIPIVEDKSLVDMHVDSIEIEEFTLRGEMFNSFIGEVYCNGENILFADELFCSVFVYDTTGNFIDKKLRKGKGPGEIFGLEGIYADNENFVLLDPYYGLYRFDDGYQNKEYVNLNFKAKKSTKELLRNPQPEDRGIYEIRYVNFKMKLAENDKVLMTIDTEHPRLNAFFADCETYYSNCYTIGVFDLKNGELIKPIVKRPSLYLDYKYIPNFNNVNFDVSKNRLYYNFEIDSSIYLADLDGNIKHKFGYGKANMNQNYRETTSLEAAEDNNGIEKDRVLYGRYTFLEYVDETNLLFRGYYLGKDKGSGMQIYQNNTLISDVLTPNYFKIIGYIPPYYYASGEIDEENETITVYRFKL